MKRFVSTVLALALCLGMAVCSIAVSDNETLTVNAAQEDTDFKSIVFDEQIVVGDTNAYPRMTALGDGTLLLIGGTGKKLIVKRSSDKGKTWTVKDVETYRNSNNLTWHEMNNMEYMQLVPLKVNASFKHLGGCSEYEIMTGMKGGSDYD